METKELKITIPEGQEIDWQESAKQEKIVFKKKKNTKPRSWEEYYEQQIANKKHGYYIDDGNCSVTEIMWNGYVRSDNWKNVLPSKELAEAFLAMMQLMSLRKAWVGDWEPDWNISNWNTYRESKYYIYYKNSENKYKVGCATEVNWGNIYFKSRNNAQSVIDNPNFKSILDAIYKE